MLGIKTLRFEKIKKFLSENGMILHYPKDFFLEDVVMIDPNVKSKNCLKKITKTNSKIVACKLDDLDNCSQKTLANRNCNQTYNRKNTIQRRQENEN